MAALKPSTLRIGNRYRASRLNGPYDALVIGSGPGGLTTAALLSAIGWKVAVFEQPDLKASFRFTDEVARTHELSMGSRGDREEVIMTSKGEFTTAYAMNIIDLCPVGALKIEGRQRSPAYVAQVTRTLRAALDSLKDGNDRYSVKPTWQNELTKVSEGHQATLGAYNRPWR